MVSAGVFIAYNIFISYFGFLFMYSRNIIRISTCSLARNLGGGPLLSVGLYNQYQCTYSGIIGVYLYSASSVWRWEIGTKVVLCLFLVHTSAGISSAHHHLSIVSNNLRPPGHEETRHYNEKNKTQKRRCTYVYHQWQ